MRIIDFFDKFESAYKPVDQINFGPLKYALPGWVPPTQMQFPNYDYKPAPVRGTPAIKSTMPNG